MLIPLAIDLCLILFKLTRLCCDVSRHARRIQRKWKQSFRTSL